MIFNLHLHRVWFFGPAVVLLVIGLSTNTAARGQSADGEAGFDFVKGSWWVDGFVLAGDGIGDERTRTIGGPGLGVSYYLKDRWAFRTEFVGFAIDQPDGLGDSDASAVGVSFLGRWHWVQRDRWSAFMDAGAGLLLSDPSVPAQGTHFNFMPQVGVGGTYEVRDGVHLTAGVRFLHISNAGLQGGDENNPGADHVTGFVGLMFAF